MVKASTVASASCASSLSQERSLLKGDDGADQLQRLLAKINFVKTRKVRKDGTFFSPTAHVKIVSIFPLVA